MYKNAIEVTFGGRLVCKNIDKASQVSKAHNMDCITLEGMCMYISFGNKNTTVTVHIHIHWLYGVHECASDIMYIHVHVGCNHHSIV